MDPISVLIVDDHPLAREGLRVMLEAAPRVQVIGEAGDGLEALDQVAKLHPRVVLMDVQMPRMDGLEATRRIKDAHPTTTVILISSYEDDDQVIGGVLAGAAGYLLKDVSRDVLADALASAADGSMVIKAALLRRAMARLALACQTNARTSLTRKSAEELTARELEVLKLLADGRSNKEVAAALDVAEITVKKHVQRIIAKLGVSDRTQAATAALRSGLIT